MNWPETPLGKGLSTKPRLAADGVCGQVPSRSGLFALGGAARSIKRRELMVPRRNTSARTRWFQCQTSRPHWRVLSGPTHPLRRPKGASNLVYPNFTAAWRAHSVGTLAKRVRRDERSFVSINESLRTTLRKGPRGAWDKRLSLRNAREELSRAARRGPPTCLVRRTRQLGHLRP